MPATAFEWTAARRAGSQRRSPGMQDVVTAGTAGHSTRNGHGSRSCERQRRGPAGIGLAASVASNRTHYWKQPTWIGGHVTDSNFAGNRMHSETQHWQRTWIAGHAADSRPNRQPPAQPGYHTDSGPGPRNMRPTASSTDNRPHCRTTPAADVSRGTCGRQRARLAPGCRAEQPTGSGRGSPDSEPGRQPPALPRTTAATDLAAEHAADSKLGWQPDAMRDTKLAAEMDRRRTSLAGERRRCEPPRWWRMWTPGRRPIANDWQSGALQVHHVGSERESSGRPVASVAGNRVGCRPSRW